MRTLRKGFALSSLAATYHTTPEMGWSGLTNGRLLEAAEKAGFEVMITGDKNLVSQQRLSGRRLSVLELSTTHWPTIRQHPRLIDDAIAEAADGIMC